MDHTQALYVCLWMPPPHPFPPPPLQSNPNYNQEKSRCEYLHNKLAHIKRLISEYDQQQLLRAGDTAVN